MAKDYDMGIRKELSFGSKELALGRGRTSYRRTGAADYRGGLEEGGTRPRLRA